MTYRRFVMIAAAALAVVGSSTMVRTDPCGDPPPAQFRQSDNDRIKGDLEGGARFLSGWVGNAQLGGKILRHCCSPRHGRIADAAIGARHTSLEIPRRHCPV